MRIKPIPQIRVDIEFSEKEIEALKTAAKAIEEIDRFIKASTNYTTNFEGFLNTGYYNADEPAEMLRDFAEPNQLNLKEYLADFINEYGHWGEN